MEKVWPWHDGLDWDEFSLVGACLRAAADGPFFPDWEFETIFGFTRAEVRSVADSWPASRDQRNELLAINSSINNLLGYPHRKDSEWSKWIPKGREATEALFEKVREMSGLNDQTRSRLRSMLDDFVAMDDQTLEDQTGLVKDVVPVARRLGIEIPERLDDINSRGPGIEPIETCHP